jgi:hypothetical protein
MENQEKKHEKVYKIFVNTREKDVTTDTLTFEDVVKLAFGTVPTGDGILITVLFHHADQHPADGSLLPGQTVKIKNNTSFDVTQTNRS